MTCTNRSYPDCGQADTRFEVDFHDMLEALLRDCLDGLQLSDIPLRRELFRRTEFERQALDLAAGSLGLDVEQARWILAQIRHDVAVTLALALCDPSGARSVDGALFRDRNARPAFTPLP